VALATERLRELYRLMLLTRRLDEEAVALQRQGVLTAFPPLTGQEAAQCASAMAAQAGDFIFPSYRELGVAVARGIDLVGYLVAYRGFWNGGLYDPIASRFAPIASSVGSHALHAVGWAMGARLDRSGAAALVYFGDGATSEGDVHEAMNFAGVYRSPVVFFVQNNGWAISLPLEKQTAAPIYKKAEAYGFPGVRVDGNDAEAVHDATAAALERARAGEGPTLIEAMTYRIGPHSTADDPTRYRDAGDVEKWRAEDPLERLRARLAAEGTEKGWFDSTAAGVRAQVAQVREAVSAAQPPSGEEMFDVVYAAPPPDLDAQKREWQAAHAETDA
jgi:2-oxoisovalerate dehydrogenase E1 component alpha subunit